jgi:hypothetical protein
MKAALALALLALCWGCGKRPAPADAPAPTTSAPSRAPDTSQSNRFVVCPGDPRCPRRKDGRPAEGAN